MTPSQLGLVSLPPELFPIVAAHLPLYTTPSTLLSLTLVNRHLSEIVLPILFSRLILRNEDHALQMIQRLLDEPELGQGVRELHIMSGLSEDTKLGRKPFDVVTGLKKVVTQGLLPHIHTLGLHLLSGWHPPVGGTSIYDLAPQVYGDLRSDFWVDVTAKCPRLKDLILDNVGDARSDRWLEDCGLYDIQGLTTLVHLQPLDSGTEAGHSKLMKNLRVLSPSLHTLAISQPGSIGPSASPLFALDFPHLKSLSLHFHFFDNLSVAMAFWKRHPTLETLELEKYSPMNNHFTKDFDSDFLPNLRYLKTDFEDVQILAPILHHLIGLEINSSIVAQMPYLFGSILPEGLPNLKSLYIGELPFEFPEDAHWYEKEDGEFEESISDDPPASLHTSINQYIHSIAKGAPNLIELGMYLQIEYSSQFMHLSRQLKPFLHLERLYLESFQCKFALFRPHECLTFSAGAHLLGSACRSLKSVTNTGTVDLPYLSARIRRDDAGHVEKVTMRKGCGMQVGREEIAFLT
ncbi:hypothetical protein CPB84DRAFT_271773 [Gymnopilus junonius]|uniref:F-box domain-containing protein n=1 Tax=Gymnopilus junonius TaxID=109634 RepID=A0A9P5TQY8_GYMJU|nr:hypothetical protein CPB84DRAFT_271773 [Gymnopilus junonius]